MDPYEQPLAPSRSEIRLLTLLPAAHFDTEIQCLLDVVSLDENTDFEALSYVWGDPTIREPISVGGKNVAVTANLIAALRRLRQPQSRRVLWVDAVCIDQGHTAEKNAQVSLMARIYRSAKSVIAWLGEPTEEMEAAILWAQEYFNETPMSGPASSSTFRPPSSSQLSRSSAPTKDNDGEDGKTQDESSMIKLSQAMLGISQFQALAYWTRMWTLQEYRLPTTEPISLCGPYSFSTTQLLEPAIGPLLWAFVHQAEQAMSGLQELPSLSSFDSPYEDILDSMRSMLVPNQEEVEPDPRNPIEHWMNYMKRKEGDVKNINRARLRIIQIINNCVMRMNRELSSEARAPGPNLGSPTPESGSAVPQHEKETLRMVIEHADTTRTMDPFGFESLRKPLEGSYWPMQELLTDSKDRQCRDVKDKIYALYGMAPETLQLLYPPDYNKHFGQIFRETAAYVLQYEHRAASFMFQKNGFQGLKEVPGMSSYPSWVPDFGIDGPRNAPDYRLLHSISNRLTEWAYAHPAQILNGLQTLETPALLLGEVFIQLEFGETAEAITAQITSLLEQGSHVNGGEALIRLCTKDDCLDPSSFLREQLTGKMSILAGRKLVVTERGRLGICPSSIRDGDLAAFLPFLAQPAILRECDKSPTGVANAHKMVGFALFPELHQQEGRENKEAVDDVLAQEPVRLFIE